MLNEFSIPTHKYRPNSQHRMVDIPGCHEPFGLEWKVPSLGILLDSRLHDYEAITLWGFDVRFDKRMS
jgi:hypothetical protein